MLSVSVHSEIKMGKSSTRLTYLTFALVLLCVYCSDSGTEKQGLEKKIVPLLAESIRMNQRLADLPDSLIAERQKLFADFDVQKEELQAWLDKNQGNVEMWRKVIEQIQEEVGKADIDPATLRNAKRRTLEKKEN